MSTFFFSFIPSSQVIDPILPIPSWIFTAVLKNVGEVGEDADAVLKLGSLYSMEG